MESSELLKERVKEYWSAKPCEAEDWTAQGLTLEYFDRIASHRYAAHPYIDGFAQFQKWKGKRVLEIGVGAGTDFCRWAAAGCRATGVDLTPTAITLTRANLTLHHLDGELFNADAESLPFDDGEFDLVYSFGVLHHTPNTSKAIQEVRRVLRSGGEFRIMLYNIRSWVTVRSYLEYGPMQGRLFASPEEALAHNKESPGTKAYTRAQIHELFQDFRGVVSKAQLTEYDVWDEMYRHDLKWKIAHSLWPRRVVRALGDSFGWNWLISGRRP